MPGDTNAPAGRWEIGTEQTQERSFARSIWPQKADYFPSLDRTRDLVEYSDAVEGLARVVNFNDRHKQLLVASSQLSVLMKLPVISEKLTTENRFLYSTDYWLLKTVYSMSR
jgi:hypothetical protein